MPSLFVFVLAAQSILRIKELWGQAGRARERKDGWGRFHGGTSFCTLHAIFITPGAKHDLAKISSQGLLEYDRGLGGKTTCHG